MNRTIEEKKKELVLTAFDTLFNKPDYAAAEHYWSPKYIQHSAHIAPGREGLFNLPHVIVLEPGLVIFKIYNGYWFFGRPTIEELRQDLRAVLKKCRPDWDITRPELKPLGNG